ncbi:hypothetical protein [Psychroflexus sp. MES1-P1E]|uniref:hypothetical protein n=1 Tax=Psychroflexus sp. MES1-P1E TaxID=2058320 RepID=UPI0011AE25E7|nr:hypothetical protein [Psychroflexus sp. MES1-P1E]
MQRPFNIFPSFGYKNSQFQILATKDDIKIKIFHKGDCVKEILTSQGSTVSIQRLDEPGIYTATCDYKGEIYEQEINVRDAFRLGSSEYKKAFVFDNSEYSFFLMKDRLQLYDEVKNILLTENHYSPTEIYQVDKSNFLFITELGTKSNGIVNLGIYNTNSYSIVGELTNDYQTIKILPKTNKAWLFKKSTQSIHCFKLINNLGNVFTEIRNFENAADYEYSSERGKISINQNQKIIFSDTKNINKYIEIAKTSKNAIDRRGNNLRLDSANLKVNNELDGFDLNIDYSNDLSLHESDFLHLGSELNGSSQFTDLTDDTNNIKEGIIDSLPENKTYFNHSLPDADVKKEEIIQHQVFPTLKGLFIIEKKSVRIFTGITLRKRDGVWSASSRTSENNLFSVIYTDNQTSTIKIKPTNSFRIIDYDDHCLIAKAGSKNYVFRGKNVIEFPVQCSFSFNTVNDNAYLFVKDEESYSVFETSNLEYSVLEKVKILNDDLIKSHEVVWFAGKEKHSSEHNYLNAFDLSRKFKIQLDEKKAQHSLFKDASDFQFNQGHILSSNKIVINPKSAVIKDSVLGSIEAHSPDLSKIVSQRINHIYLSLYNTSLKKYQEREIKLDSNKYQESHLSPNGQFLVLQDDSNKYQWFDIEKNETVRFFSGNFLSFSKEGSLIIEEDGTRDVKIFDPLTFSDITPPNYHHYRFLSPDGMLYSQLVLKTRYFNKLNGNEINIDEVSKYRRDLDTSSMFISMNPTKMQEYEREKDRVNKNRRKFFEKNKSSFDELDIDDHSKITSQTVVKVEKFTEIGIVGTNITTEILFPEDLAYYNYAAFSYDNKYFAYVGKPSSKGLIHLFKLDYVESNNELLVIDSYLSRYPRYASWVCGFSKTGYFATYDSTPDTYLLKIDEELFESKTDEIELRENIHNSKSNIYHQYHKWNEIESKNFLCFSPSGEFLALSEEGYEPKTLGGYGHQESNAVHIAITETGKIIDSFTGHGDKIKENRRKKVTFVAFSEDEKRIMTLSSDGVVVIRDLKIKEPIRDSKKEEMPAANIV